MNNGTHNPKRRSLLHSTVNSVLFTTLSNSLINTKPKYNNGKKNNNKKKKQMNAEANQVRWVCSLAVGLFIYYGDTGTSNGRRSCAIHLKDNLISRYIYR